MAARKPVPLVECRFCRGTGETCTRCGWEPCECECDAPRRCRCGNDPDCVCEGGPRDECTECVGTGYVDPGRGEG